MFGRTPGESAAPPHAWGSGWASGRLAARAAVAALLLFSGAAGGWWAGSPASPDLTGVAAAARASLEHPAGGLVPAGWSPESVEALPAPDLSGEGFQLVDTEVVGPAEQPVVQFTYAGASGTRLDLFQQPLPAPPPPVYRYDQAQGHAVVAWSDNTAAYALLSTLPADHLARIAERLSGRQD